MNALVTGGGGFLGRAIVERLIARGDGVRSFARGDYPELRAIGAETLRGDIADRQAVTAACAGCDAVFHVAAHAGLGGPYRLYHRTNVIGTKNVIAACRAGGISRLVYTSSPSVVFDGTDHQGVDESTPVASRFHAHYPRTKAIAERAVLASNGPGLATTALRPHLIWGPRDNHLVPRIIARAARLRRIGRDNKLVDCTYIDNAADAHLLACDRLAPGAPVAGRAYFIGNGEPRPLWDLINAILAAANLPPVTRTIPRWAARIAGGLVETTCALLRLSDEPPITRFLVEEMSTAHWFDITAARRDLAYRPAVSIDEGLRRLEVWLHETRD